MCLGLDYYIGRPSSDIMTRVKDGLEHMKNAVPMNSGKANV